MFHPLAKADKKGPKIASERLTLTDDPLVVGGLDSPLFDGDGFAARMRTMIEAGVQQCETCLLLIIVNATKDSGAPGLTIAPLSRAQSIEGKS